MAEKTTSTPRKLRILCFHGANNTSEILKYQMKNFAASFDQLCEFSYLDGLWDSYVEPIEFFVKRGVAPPYKYWLTEKYVPYRNLPDGSAELAIGKTQVNFMKAVETITEIIRFLNEQEEPFDGFAGFSQGVYTFQAVLKILQYFKKHVKLRHVPPSFVIDFNGPNFDHITYEFVNKSFIAHDFFIPDTESIHFVSDSDMFSWALNNHRSYERPIVINHTHGHRPVKNLPMEDLRIVADFLKRQFKRKNGD